MIENDVNESLPALEEQLGITKLDSNTTKLAKKLIKAKKLDEVKDLTNMFNVAQAKKNVFRIMKLNQLLDQVSDNMIDRFERRPDEFTNKELLDYMSVVQNSIDRAQKSVSMIADTPAIQLNQNNVNISVTKDLSRDEAQNVMDAVSKLLERIKQEDIQKVLETEDLPMEDISYTVEDENNESEEDAEIEAPFDFNNIENNSLLEEEDETN